MIPTLYLEYTLTFKYRLKRRDHKISKTKFSLNVLIQNNIDTKRKNSVVDFCEASRNGKTYKNMFVEIERTKHVMDI